MEIVSALFQPTLQEMFHETLLKMQVMDVEQHQDYLRNIKVLILKVANDWHVLKEYHTENHDHHASGHHKENNCGVYNEYPSGGDVIINWLWEIYQSCER